MSHSNGNKEKVFQEIANYTPKDVGFLEEDVKIKVVLPILQCLGHGLTDLSFEHSGRDIFIRGPSRETCIIVETKKLGENLERHLPQLKRYMEESQVLLGMITNGDEFRIYVCSVDVPLCKMYRRDLAREENIETLQHLLSREALLTEEKFLTSINEEFARRAEKLKHKLNLATDMMKAFKSKDSKKLEELTSQARKADINLYLDLEEAEGLLKSWTKLTEYIRKLTERVRSS
ncbi:MAG: type I restriction enzyme HsdR N-terminal domain-containing protein [Candidatus Bathyarchaeia archaeon]